MNEMGCLPTTMISKYQIILSTSPMEDNENEYNRFHIVNTSEQCKIGLYFYLEDAMNK